MSEYKITSIITNETDVLEYEIIVNIEVPYSENLYHPWEKVKVLDEIFIKEQANICGKLYTPDNETLGANYDFDRDWNLKETFSSLYMPDGEDAFYINFTLNISFDA